MILKETFRSDGKYNNELKEVQLSLCTKTWLIHIYVNIGRVIYPIFDNSFWQNGYRDYKENETINQEFIEESEDVIKFLIIVFIVLGLLLDVVCWRYRHLSSSIFYFELISLTVQSFIPWDFGDFRAAITLITIGGTWIMYANGSRGNIVASVFCTLFQTLFCHQMILKEEFAFGIVSGAILNAITIFIIGTILAMCITYIAFLKGRIVQLMVENLNLLDKMHEGLVVVRKEDLGL